MKYFGKQRKKRVSWLYDTADDPMEGVANLFDIGLVFIVGLIICLFSMSHLKDLFDETSNVTIVKESSSGLMEIITKKNNEIKVRKITKEKVSGQGERLGVAFRLTDGSVVYVPDE